eukprot:768117-Hanusia_phi.AAC.4
MAEGSLHTLVSSPLGSRTMALDTRPVVARARNPSRKTDMSHINAAGFHSSQPPASQPQRSTCSAAKDRTSSAAVLLMNTGAACHIALKPWLTSKPVSITESSGPAMKMPRAGIANRSMSRVE